MTVFRTLLHHIWHLLGRPCVAQFGKNHLCFWRPKRLTLAHNPAVYRWLWWNFTWDDRVC